MRGPWVPACMFLQRILYVRSLELYTTESIFGRKDHNYSASGLKSKLLCFQYSSWHTMLSISLQSHVTKARDANLICNKRVRWTPKKIEKMLKRLR